MLRWILGILIVIGTLVPILMNERVVSGPEINVHNNSKALMFFEVADDRADAAVLDESEGGRIEPGQTWHMHYRDGDILVVIAGRKSGRRKIVPLDESSPDIDISIGPDGEIRIRVVP